MTHFFGAQLSKGGDLNISRYCSTSPLNQRDLYQVMHVPGPHRVPALNCWSFLAKDIEQFDPDNCDNIDNYFREPYPSLKDGPKGKKRRENSETRVEKPALQLSTTFCSHFLLVSPVTSIHVSAHTFSLMTQQGKHSLQKIRKMSQVVWETVVTLKAAVDANRALSDLTPSCQIHPPPQNFTRRTRPGGVKIQTSPTIRVDLGIRPLLSREVGDWFTQNCPSRFP